jgi:hypothetical protein
VRLRRIRRSAQILFLGTACIASNAFAPGESVNKDSKIVADFESRVADYVKLHNRARSDLAPAKTTEAPEMIVKREQELADKIRVLRPEAKHGDIFDQSSRAEFRRLVKISSQGTSGAHIRTSLARSEPVDAPIRVNGTYPKDMALQSTPSTLLQNLPPLPKEVEYRVVGKKLVLRDIEANLIIDYADDMIR